MELSEVIRQRRSIRQFTSEPVPREILNAILSEASWSPSWGNTQPWKIILVTGRKLEDFRKANTLAFLKEKPGQTDIPMTFKWPSPYYERYVALGKEVMGAMSVDRHDAKGRQEHYSNMFSLFGASALMLICIENNISLPYAMLDVGILVQTICLSAFDKGVGTCILEAAVDHPKLVRQLFPIDDNSRIAIGIALGMPDPDAPVNKFQRQRVGIETSVQWVE